MVGFYFELVTKIVIFFYALWIGELAIIIYNRIPNDIPIKPTYKPKCSYCGNEITFKYFFPIFRYFLGKWKCISCGTKMPVIYLLIELSILIYILLLSTTFSFLDEKFISKSLYGAFLIVLAFIYKTHKQLKTRLIWMLITFILAYRGYNGILPNVIDLFISCFVAYMIFFLLRKDIQQINDQEYKICIILMASFEVTINYIFATIYFVYKIIYSIPFIRKYIGNYKFSDNCIVISMILFAIIQSLISY